MGPDRYDRNWSLPEWAPSRCAGVCNDDIAFCMCGWGKYKHEQDPNADPLAPPIKRGRPMSECHLTTDDKGNKVKWIGPDSQPYEGWYGPDGWCVADKPKARCPCRIDGWVGEFCDIPTENFCPGQCSGHGKCHLGYCRCHLGWYGNDCSRLAEGFNRTEGDHVHKPYLRHLVREPLAAKDPLPPSATRLRPLIYVYDLPARVGSQFLQYRGERHSCTWRAFGTQNETYPSGWTYGVESHVHELLLLSDHRTFDPEEADFFYVPVYTSCLIHPIVGYADTPAFPINGGQRTMHAAMALLEAKRWLEVAHPWWNRTGGRDHIWMISHDEGACWAPNEIWPSIILSHWGRMDNNSRSETSYLADTFSHDYRVDPQLPDGWLKYIQYHPCFDPVKDLAIPVFKPIQQYHRSPLLGVPFRERDLLMFFRGDVGLHHGGPEGPPYSRGIRQSVYHHYKADRWERHKIIISYRDEHPGDYSEFLARSIYCLAPPGEGWTARIEDAILNGCIPVIIMDGVQAQLESLLNFSAFSIRISQKAVPEIPQILMAIPPARVAEMRAALHSVWHRFGYRTHPLIIHEAHNILQANQPSNLATTPSPPAQGNITATGGPESVPLQHPSDLDALFHNDAFHTIIHWLYSRIPYTRGSQQGEHADPLSTAAPGGAGGIGGNAAGSAAVGGERNANETGQVDEKDPSGYLLRVAGRQRKAPPTLSHIRDDIVEWLYSFFSARIVDSR